MPETITTEYKPYEGIYLDGETEYIEIKEGSFGAFMFGKALSAEEIKDRVTKVFA